MGEALELDRARLLRLRRALTGWYARSARDLPWRRTRDPYRIWVAEIMLQQTQVAAVIPYYEKFLERFPDVAALARAYEDDVLAAWSGLGYYRRARSLQAGARAVMERHGGVLPSEARELRALPGIGRYTAGAIASIAFDRREPILDGNVRRVLSRWFGIEAARIGNARAEALLWEIAARLADGPRPGDLNQALMELGAMVCRPREAVCERCPASAGCVARAEDRVASLPSPKSRARSISVDLGVAWIERDGRILLERPTAKSLLRGTWDLPARTPGSELAPALMREHGLELALVGPMGRLEHTILHRRIAIEVSRFRLVRGRIAGGDRLRWVALADLERVPVSGATRKVVRLRLTGAGRGLHLRPRSRKRSSARPSLRAADAIA